MNEINLSSPHYFWSLMFYHSNSNPTKLSSIGTSSYKCIRKQQEDPSEGRQEEERKKVAFRTRNLKLAKE